METECEQWTDSQTDEDSDTEEILCGINESSATDLYHHPQLDSDIEAVRTLYSDSAVSIREYGSIDDVDVDLNINANILDEEVALAWGINASEPIVIRLRFSLSQYLDGAAPSVEVFQPSNTDNFNFGKQLQNILTVFLSREWKHLSNENVVVRQKRRQSWFRPSGTIKKVRARLSIWLPLSKTNGLQEPGVKERIILPAMKLNRFTNHTTSYTIKNPAGELFTYTPSGKRVVVSAVKSSAQLSTKQLIELLFSSQAIGHCKTTPTLQHGFLVQVMRYAEQRIPTLNEYCVVCDERHVFQNGPLLKPAVCTRELCVFSFHTLGVMSGATEEVATGAEVVDLLVAMCRAALESSRKSIIFEPYPSVVDPCNPKTLAFSPKRKSYERLQKALDSVLLVRRMAQGPYSEIKKQMDKIDPLAHPLLQWILASNRSHIVKLPLNRQLEFMHTPHQFLLISSPPSKEARFQTAKKLYGSTFAFHGSSFRRVSRTEDSSPYPIPGLASDILHMRVKEGSKIRNLLRFATARIQGEGKDCNGTSLRQVVFTGSGRGVTKTITCVEILKRRVGGLHQVSKLYYKTVNEVWESPQQGAPGITVERTVPAICILLSKDPLDPQEPGYQPPQTLSVPTEDGERHRGLLRPAHSPSSQHTAKRVCLDDWSVCSP
ncbi:protein mono-ADP-ribosyltransferase PARP6-like isoform X1 [Chaetodon auriga]|uniref:protein mono-ADP-ribosyltransferase PARP6-like isoform X1 n=1 Tax=Chaetodon auriga TaxID=39042 RepID=UPI004032E91D